MSGTLYVAISAILILTLVVFATIMGFYYNRRFICYNNPSPWCFANWQCSDSSMPLQNAISASGGCTYVESTMPGCTGVMCPSSSNCPLEWCFISNYQYDQCNCCPPPTVISSNGTPQVGQHAVNSCPATTTNKS